MLSSTLGHSHATLSPQQGEELGRDYMSMREIKFLSLIHDVVTLNKHSESAENLAWRYAEWKNNH